MQDIVTHAYESHRVALCAYLASMTRNPTTAEDFAQEAFARLAAEVQAGRRPDNVRAWLYQVARNLVVSDVRRRQTADRHAHTQLEPRAASAEEEILRVERVRELRRMLRQLDPIDQRSMMMAALGYSGAEIGRAVGRSENAVRTRLCRARLRLRLEIEGATPATPVNRDAA